VRTQRVCTREPSGSRASTQGDVASTRRPRSHDALDHMEDGLGGVPHATLAVSRTVPSRAPALLRGKAARCRVSVIGLTLALISMDGLADDSVGDVLLVLLGAAAFVIGVAGFLRPGLLIKGRSAWGRLPRPFLHRRVIGGEVDPHDPLQRLITRATGILFVIVGAGLIVGGAAPAISRIAIVPRQPSSRALP
jgi:hypothetical protein